MCSTVQDPIAQQVHKAAEALLTAAQKMKLSEALNHKLNQFLKWPYRAGPACITDSEGISTQGFESIIYTSSKTDSQQNQAQVKAETVAACLHAVNTLTPEELRAGYEQIATIKRLKRTPSSHTDFPHTDTPLGIIFSVQATLPIERLGEEMALLNKSHPSTEWPDMIVVLTRGT